MTTFSAYDSTVNSIYLAFYGRPADPVGLHFWSAQLANNDGDLSAIIQFFAGSEEAQVRFGTDSVAERIAEIYQQLFNRQPEATGMAFWTNAIENGHASIADVAVSILKGAQGTDASLATLRQQAVDAFTAQVEADGSLYDGYASIEAARILVRAVTGDANADDLAALVKAAVSFADTATKNPAVVDAIAVNTTLLALFDTPRGSGDPVALAQALADTAKAAAGDPVTLEQLLRGGGMDKVLKVMPANATLQDVVKALAAGGLPAAVDVVYPPVVAPTPVPVFKLTFDSVSQDLLDTNKTDTVTNVDDATVKFKYSGNISGKTFEYSTDGGEHWQTKYLTIDSANRLIVIEDVQLAPYYDKRPSDVSTQDAPGNHITSFVLRATDANGKVVSGSVEIEYDGYAATPQAIFDTSDSIVELYSNGVMTNDPAFTVEHEEGAVVEYKAVVPQHGRGAPSDDNEGWSTTKPTLDEGYNSFLVRQTDAAGNRSEAQLVVLALDTIAPDTKPAIVLDDAGSGASGQAINISNLGIESYSGWQYSIDGGKWILGAPIHHSAMATFELAELDLDVSSGSIRVRQIDAAGNFGQASEALDFVIDNTPEPKLAVDVSSTGITLSSTLAGELNFISGPDFIVLDTSNGTSEVTAGVPVSVGAQNTVVSGLLAVYSSVEEDVLRDADEIEYTLGTDTDDGLSANYGWGFGGNDIMGGTEGDDHLYGGDGMDELSGEGGDDYLDGGAGADLLTGGRGADIFVIGRQGESVAPPVYRLAGRGILPSYDTVTDFSVAGGDRIEFGTGVIADRTEGITISTTFYMSLDAMLADIEAVRGASGFSGSVIAGQVGRDVYIVALGADELNNILPTAGGDSLLRLQNTSVLDLDVDHFVDMVGDTNFFGDGTVRDLTDGDDVPDQMFDHATYVRGLDGNDVIVGSAGDDFFIGGLGGDVIVFQGGRDTVIVNSSDESNGATLHDLSLDRTYDVVYVEGLGQVVFDFGRPVSEVKFVQEDRPEEASSDEMFALLTSLYIDAGGSESSAVAIRTDYNEYVVLLDNGDGIIDANDVAVVVVGTGSFEVEDGTVVFTPMSD